MYKMELSENHLINEGFTLRVYGDGTWQKDSRVWERIPTTQLRMVAHA